jgi:hypothetical protein
VQVPLISKRVVPNVAPQLNINLEQQTENEKIPTNDVVNEEVVQPQPIELRRSARERRPTQIDDYVYFNE